MMRYGGFGLRLVLVMGVATLLAGPAAAGNWPRFRGPNGTGVSDDKDVPVGWSGKNVLWKTALPGAGNSSPVVWGRRVFVQSATPDGKQRLLVCLGAADGKILWSRSAPGARARTHPRNTLASSTPATDGKRVYALFWDGKDLALSAYDFRGEPVWTHDLGGFTSQHGAGASPILCDGKVILANDQDGSSELVALDAATGRPAWRAPRKAFRACYSTPFVLDGPDRARQLVVASTAGVTSYNPRTGAENWAWTWKFTGMALRTVASPVYGPGMIFANSGDGSGARNMVAVKVGDRGEVTMAWQNKRSLPYVPTMLVHGEHLYWVNDHGVAGCQVAATGKTVWTARLGEPVTASPVLIDGKIYAVSEAGTVSVFAAAPVFQRLARNAVGEAVVASPAVAGNRLFIRGRRHLICIGNPPK